MQQLRPCPHRAIGRPAAPACRCLDLDAQPLVSHQAWLPGPGIRRRHRLTRLAHAMSGCKLWQLRLAGACRHQWTRLDRPGLPATTGTPVVAELVACFHVCHNPDAQHLVSCLSFLGPASGGGSTQQARGTAGWRTLPAKPSYLTRFSSYRSHQISAVRHASWTAGFCQGSVNRSMLLPGSSASSVNIPCSVWVLGDWVSTDGHLSRVSHLLIRGKASSHSEPLRPDKASAVQPAGPLPCFQ